MSTKTDTYDVHVGHVGGPEYEMHKDIPFEKLPVLLEILFDRVNSPNGYHDAAGNLWCSDTQVTIHQSSPEEEYED